MPIRTSAVKDASRADYHLQKAAAALALGDWKQALERYRSALDFDAENEAARMGIAELTILHGDLREAAAQLASVIEARPPHPEAWNLLGIAFMKNGERDDAKRCWRRSLSIAPGFKMPASNLDVAPSFPKIPGRTPILARAVRSRLFAKKAARLSVCLIVKDEEELIGECLDSVAGLADETIVLDTGSSDRTVEIARSRGARVFEHVWKEDFSEARNAVLAKARGDWILMLDADERLAPESKEPLRRHIEAGESDYATVEIGSEIDGDTLAFRAVRLCRNYQFLRFTGRVHEQIASSLEVLRACYGLRSAEAPVRLRHLGYERELFARRGKAERNERLLAAELEANPDNAYALLKHGESLFSQHLFEEAAGPIEKAWHLTRAATAGRDDHRLLEEPATVRAACAVGSGRYEDALSAIEEFHALAPPTANTLYLEGVARWALGLDGAAKILQSAIELAGEQSAGGEREQRAGVSGDENTGRAGGQSGCGSGDENRGGSRDESAGGPGDESAGTASESAGAASDECAGTASDESAGVARDECAGGPGAAVASSAMDALQAPGRAGGAASRLDVPGSSSATRSGPSAAGATFTLPEIRGATPRYILGSLALQAGDAALAGEWFARALAKDSAHREARMGLAQAHYYQQRPEKSVAVLVPLLKENPADLGAWKAGALYLVLSAGHEQAAEAWLEAALAVFPGDESLARMKATLLAGAEVGAQAGE